MTPVLTCFRIPSAIGKVTLASVALSLLVGLVSCTKQNYEDIQFGANPVLPEPEVVYVVDCDGLGLNVGDSCIVVSNDPELDGLPGTVSWDCECESILGGLVGEVVTVAFWRQNDGPVLTVTVVSDPPFIEGPMQVEVEMGLTEVEFVLPPGTEQCTFGHGFFCQGEPEIYVNEVQAAPPGQTVDGAYVVAAIDCW